MSSVDGGLRLGAPDGAVATLRPPWPCAAQSLDGLIDGLRHDRVVAVLLVRRGGYAAAVVQGARVVASKVGRRHVQGKTKAGGWSQQRYARRRDDQARRAFGAAADAAVDVLLPRRVDLQGVVTGGDRAAVRAVLDDPRLRFLEGLPQGRFLAVSDPRRRVLDEAVRRSRAVHIDVFDPDRDRPETGAPPA